MRRAHHDREKYLGELLGRNKRSIWTSAKVRECYSEVEQEDEGHVSIAQAILRKSTGFLRRITAPIDGVGGVTLSYVCHRIPLEDCICWVSSGNGDGHKKKKQCRWWCAVCGQYDWRAPNRVLVRQDTEHRNAKVFRARAAPQGKSDNLIHALKLLANQQNDGDSPVGKIAPGLLEKRRRKIMDGRKLFTAIDNCAAVKIAELPKETRSKTVVPCR